MIQQDILLQTVESLEKIGIPYMVTGAVAVSFYGRPRATHDVDLVLEMDRNRISVVVSTFEKDFYVSDVGIVEAIAHRTMFNLIHHKSGIKVDCWLPKPTPFNLSRFRRRQPHQLFGRTIYLTSPEDLILMKLCWYKDSAVDKHLSDARGVLEIQAGQLDLSYMLKWAKDLEVTDLWQEIQGEI